MASRDIRWASASTSAAAGPGLVGVSGTTSVLRIDHDPARPGGLTLTSCSMGQDDTGDQGVYLSTAIGALRLPFNETIWVWCEGGEVRARHVLWAAGMPALELEYAIARAG